MLCGGIIYHCFNGLWVFLSQIALKICIFLIHKCKNSSIYIKLNYNILDEVQAFKTWNWDWSCGRLAIESYWLVDHIDWFMHMWHLYVPYVYIVLYLLVISGEK